MTSMIPFRFAIPKWLSWGTEDTTRAIDIPSVEIADIENNVDRRARTLKHLIKANHANFSIIYHDLQYHNHTSHILGAAYFFNSQPEHLSNIYDAETKHLEPWRDSPSEISKDDWRDFLGKREYQRAFIDFFEDQLVQVGYSWPALLEEYAFQGKEPLINGMLVGGLGHPLIHLGYAHELASPTLIIEALAMGACFYSPLHKYLDDPIYSIPTLSMADPSPSPLTLLHKMHADPRFDGLFAQPGPANIAALLEKREKEVLEYWNAWTVGSAAEFAVSQHAAAALLAASATQPARRFDFFLVHVLTSSHAVRVLLPRVPARLQMPLVRQWWLFAIVVYVAQLRPRIDVQSVTRFPLGGRDWMYVEKQALTGRGKYDAHFVKALRSMEVAKDTWGDEDQFYLKAAVKFAEGWEGWGGFGVDTEMEGVENGG